MKMKDLTGHRFGRLTAVSPIGRRDPRNRATIYWLCKCDCGVEKEIAGGALRSGLTQSCGCFNAERRIQRMTKHGLAGSRIYNTWCNMNARCSNLQNDAYKHYGGRGIVVCDRWKTFALFRADVGDPPTEQHSLDRIDSNGNYEPGNVRWALPTTQARNKRGTIVIKIRDERITLADAAEKYGIPYDKLHNRIRELGWDPEVAIDYREPVRAGRER